MLKVHQITFGWLQISTGDPTTLTSQIDKLKRRFGLHRVVLVGDRGVITSARIEEELKPAGLDWLTALRAPAIQALAGETGPLLLSLFDDRDLAEIESPHYPGEAAHRVQESCARRGASPQARRAARGHRADLARIQARIRRDRQPLRGAERIGLAVGAVLGRRKVAKHFQITISDYDLSFIRDHAQIALEAALDGIYVLRTNVPTDHLNAAQAVTAYKSLARVERAFRRQSPRRSRRPQSRPPVQRHRCWHGDIPACLNRYCRITGTDSTQ